MVYRERFCRIRVTLPSSMLTWGLVMTTVEMWARMAREVEVKCLVNGGDGILEFWNSECLKAVSCSDEGDAFDSKGELREG